MTSEPRVLAAVRAELGKDARIGLRDHPVALDIRDGVLIIEGEVEHLRAKKLALDLASRAEGVIGILDRLRIAPAEHMGDRQLGRSLGRALLAETEFADYALLRRSTARPPVFLRQSGNARGSIAFRVDAGVVTLTGRVAGLLDKRLAGVIAWWVPGVRDLINGIAVDPPDTDDSSALAEAVRLVLAKDPRVDATAIAVAATEAQVLLSGTAPTRKDSEMAEKDAWCVGGVEGVTNGIGVRHTSS